MPNRPRSHILEDQARAQLIKLFSNAGWSVERLSEDYGEDFLVRIFDNEQSTPWNFFVQSKATDNISKFKLRRHSAFSYPFKTDHLCHWRSFSEPVLVTITDVKTGNVYWECVQTYLEDLAFQASDLLNTQTTIHIRIPTDNILNREGIQRIKYRTKALFNRLSKEQERVDGLIEYLKSNLRMRIRYDHSDIILVPDGKFIPNNDFSMIVFGGLKGKLDKLQRILELSDIELIEVLFMNADDVVSQLRMMSSYEAKQDSRRGLEALEGDEE